MKDIIQENDKKLAELKEAASPLIKYLCENYHPHVTAIVTPTSIEVMELEATNRKDDYGYSVYQDADLEHVVDNSTESSRELGFNAVEGCKYCGKPATHEGLCEKCYNMRNY